MSRSPRQRARRGEHFVAIVAGQRRSAGCIAVYSHRGPCAGLARAVRRTVGRSAVHRSWTGVGPIPPIEAAGGQCSHPRVVELGHRQEPPGNDCDSTDNVICRISTSSASRGIDDGDNRQSGSTFPLVPVWGGWLGVKRGGRAGRPGFRCAPTGFGQRPNVVPAFWARARS
jgi:hypothetical protein